MPRNTKRAILQDYIDCLNDVCNQIITDSRFVLVNERVVTCLQDNAPLPLKLSPRGYLYFYQLVSVNSRQVIVEAYSYRYLSSPDISNEEQWVFRYEYSLSPKGNVPHAHLHLNASIGSRQLRGIHFPTGRVSFEQIIAHLIIEYMVKPRREGWLEFLANSHQRFTEQRTDPQSRLFP